MANSNVEVTKMAAQPRKAAVAATILAGQSMSNSVDLTSGSLLMLINDGDWTPANVSFQISHDNTTFVDLHDNMGVQVLRPMGPYRGVVIPSDVTSAAMYLKIRSGPLENPVKQQADRTFQCVIG